MVTRCAISPDRPWCPRRTSPSLTRAQPRPSPRWRKAKSARAPGPAWACSARAAQFTSLSVSTGPSTRGARTSAGESSPTRNGASGRWTSRPVPRSTGSAALTTARWARPGGSRAPAAQRVGDVGRVGGSGERPLGPRHGVPVDVDGFDDDGRRADVDGQRSAQIGGQRVVAADAPAAAGAFAGVAQQPDLGEPARALRSGRLGQAGVRGDLGAGEPRVVHQRAQDVLVGQRAQQLQRRLRRGSHPDSSKESCPTAKEGLD